MAMTTYSYRMDDVLKQQFDRLCEEFGMNSTIAINVFAKAVVREKRIPFEIKANDYNDRESGLKAFMALRQEAEQNGLQDMTLDEINEEIRKARYGED